MQVRNVDHDWQIYRTRFLVRAKQLTQPLVLVDAFGHEHHGCKGDYLVESSDGTCRIASREIFEDIYVPMGQVAESWPPGREVTVSRLKRRVSLRPEMQA
jgi:hypothetical protein